MGEEVDRGVEGDVVVGGGVVKEGVEEEEVGEVVEEVGWEWFV